MINTKELNQEFGRLTAIKNYVLSVRAINDDYIYYIEGLEIGSNHTVYHSLTESKNEALAFDKSVIQVALKNAQAYFGVGYDIQIEIK